MERKLIIGGIYKHFKNNFYQVISVATHSETKEKYVVYKALYKVNDNNETKDVYIRPYKMFMSKVDKNKYPEVKQEYRFENIKETDIPLKELIDNIDKELIEIRVWYPDSNEIADAILNIENVFGLSVMCDETEINYDEKLFKNIKAFECVELTKEQRKNFYEAYKNSANGILKNFAEKCNGKNKVLMKIF